MCGIAGLISLDGRPVEAELLRRMAESLSHRGPDEQAIWIDPEFPQAGLAHARLAVIDRAGGRQPMPDAAEPRRRVVFNGEIYNHLELRAELSARGRRFASDHSDTEVLLPLYAERGPDMVHALRGMFAFALYDGPGRRLVLARDRMGQKPLYWFRTARHFAFASELKALRLLADAPREIDVKALHLYLQLGYVPSPLSIYRGVRKLPPATRVTLDAGAIDREPSPEVYWPMPSPVEGMDEADAQRLTESDADGSLVGELRELLVEAVRARLRADVPLGFFLSGGLDSSLVLALARRAEPGRELHAFSVAMPEARYDESDYAEFMADWAQAEYTRLEVSPGDLRALLPTVAGLFDEPFADSSAVPTYLMAGAARRHITVALSGDGGDELFGGYDRYRAVQLGAACDRTGPLRAVASVGGRLIPRGLDLKSWRSRLRRYTDALSLEPLRRYARWASPFHERNPLEIYSSRWQEAAVAAVAVDYLRSAMSPVERLLDGVMRLDARSYLPEDVLVKVDRAAMAYGLEVRSPLLDHRVVEHAMRLPAAMRLGPCAPWRLPKMLLRRVAEGLLPHEIQSRAKMGFGVPVSAWLAGSEAAWMRERLSDGPLAESGIIDRERLARYIERHTARRADHGSRLYSLLALDEFLRASGSRVPL